MNFRFGKITVSGEGLYRGEEDKPAHFYIDTHGMEGTPEVRVEGQYLLVITADSSHSHAYLLQYQ